MAIDHNRPLPVSEERLIAVAKMVYPFDKWAQEPICLWPKDKIPEVYKIALMGEQVEWSQQLAFFLGEAYDIYNQRFR